MKNQKNQMKIWKLYRKPYKYKKKYFILQNTKKLNLNI